MTVGRDVPHNLFRYRRYQRNLSVSSTRNLRVLLSTLLRTSVITPPPYALLDSCQDERRLTYWAPVRGSW